MPISTFLFDPVVVNAAAATMGIILISGAFTKLRDLELFRYAVENYGLIEGPLAVAFARLFPVLELLAGLALIVDVTRGVGEALGLAVLGVATGGVVMALSRGAQRVECGCGQGAQMISWGLVARNAILAILVVLAGSDEQMRNLALVDYFSVAGGVLGLLVVYASANQLLANQPFLKELQS